MRKITTCLLCLLYLSGFSQNNDTFTIQGKFASLSDTILILSNANRFKEEIKTNKTGAFNKTIKGDKGYYNFGSLGLLYLSPGMSLTLRKEGSDTILSGKGSVENIIIRDIQKLQKENFPMKGRYLTPNFNTMEPVDFLKHVEYYKSSALALINRQDIDEDFKSTQTDNVQYTARYYLNSYKTRYGIDLKKEEEYFKALKGITPGKSALDLLYQIRPQYEAMHVKKLSLDDKAKIDGMVWENFDLNNGVLFATSSLYNVLLAQRIDLLVRAELTKSPYLGKTVIGREEVKMKLVKQEISNALIRETFLYKSMTSIIRASTSVEKTEKTFNEYINTAKDTYFTDQIKISYNTMKLTSQGAVSPQFSYVDINNKKVSLSSLKGNYVFVDIWATWCMPCVQEIPFLKELEKKYESKPIKFVSISVDKLKDKTKWEGYVKKNNLTGIQLFADNDFKSDFVKAYGVNSIPRFIIIDPDGKIVSRDSIRPSNPKIEETINQLLTKL